MDRDAVIVKLLKAEIYDHIRCIDFKIAQLCWSRWEMCRIMRRHHDVMGILRKILSETEDSTYLGY